MEIYVGVLYSLSYFNGLRLQATLRNLGLRTKTAVTLVKLHTSDLFHLC